MTRWEKFYQEDKHALHARSSACAGYAVNLFKAHHCRRILDLGCGAGRDIELFISKGLTVHGVDAAYSGLRIAKQRLRICTKRYSLIQCDGRALPFPDKSYDGIFCFGLLHEFTGADAKRSVKGVMKEIVRVLRPKGFLVIAALAGHPSLGLPQVRLFTERMFDSATRGFKCLKKKKVYDIGCTGSKDYRIWYGTFIKKHYK